jgi:hypothetical protein
MAVNDNTKKASVLNYNTPWLLPGPVLKGSFDQDERQHFLNLYADILTGGGGPVAGGGGLDSITEITEIHRKKGGS